MRTGWVVSSSLAGVVFTTALALAATSAQFSVGVTVVAPCTIQIANAASRPFTASAMERQPLAPAIRSSCSDGTKAAVSFEPIAPAPTTDVSTAPGIRRVTVTY